jgi:hypothetical protein
MKKTSSCNVPVILVRFSRNPHFLDSFSKKAQIPSFIKIHPVGAVLCHADSQTNVTKLIVAFRIFAKALKKSGTDQSDCALLKSDLLPPY